MDDSSTTELFFAISERIDNETDIENLQYYKEHAISIIHKIYEKRKQFESRPSPNQLSLL